MSANSTTGAFALPSRALGGHLCTRHSVDFKVSAVLRFAEVSEVKSVMPITASVGEDGLATALTIEIATDV